MPVFAFLIVGFLGAAAAYNAVDADRPDPPTHKEAWKPAKKPAGKPLKTAEALKREPGDPSAEPSETAAGKDGERVADPAFIGPASGAGKAADLGRASLSPHEARHSGASAPLERTSHQAGLRFDKTGFRGGGAVPNVGESSPLAGAGTGGSERPSRAWDSIPASWSKTSEPAAATRLVSARHDGNFAKASYSSGDEFLTGRSGANNGGLNGRNGSRTGRPGACPEGMADIDGRFCIDKWEASIEDAATGKAASPYFTPSSSRRWPGGVWQYNHWSSRPDVPGYPMPELPDFQKSKAFTPRAVSKAGTIPQGFMNKPTADKACRNAGKRLCTRREWYKACVGPGREDGDADRIAFPYGDHYQRGMCNFNVVRGHPLMLLKRDSKSLGDPRLMLAKNGGRRLLAETGTFSQCTNGYGVYDMVGNQDEIVDDASGGTMVFVGSFYSRAQGGSPKGCASAITSHAETYTDYSIGFRCCSDQ